MTTPVPRRLAVALLLLLALLGVLASALVAARQPAAGGDYVAIWGLKARALARSGSLDALFRVDPTSLASHPEYPPLWPALLALAGSAAGEYDDLRVTLLWPLICAAAALLAWRATRAEPPFRALAAAVVALLPYWRVPLHVGYAEGLLAVFLLGALLVSGEPRGDLPLALFLALAAATKQEGALAAVVAGAVLLASGRRRGALLSLFAAGAATLGWSLFAASRLAAPPRRDFAPVFDLARVADAAAALAREAGLPALAWLVGGALLLALAPAAARRSRGLLGAAALYAAALSLAFGFSTRDAAWHVRWTWDRLAFVPLVLLVPVLCEAAAEALTRPGARAPAESAPA